MAEIQVDPNQLVAGQGQQAAISSAVAGAAGVVRAAGSALGDGAGQPGAGDAWAAAWEGELAGRAQGLLRASQNLAAAAEAYRETDDGQMRG